MLLWGSLGLFWGSPGPFLALKPLVADDFGAFSGLLSETRGPLKPEAALVLSRTISGLLGLFLVHKPFLGCLGPLRSPFLPDHLAILESLRGLCPVPFPIITPWIIHIRLYVYTLNPGS